MFEIHGWVVINVALAEQEPAEWFLQKDRAVEFARAAVAEAQDEISMFDVAEGGNGLTVVRLHGLRNHRRDGALTLFRRLAARLPGAYGLLYLYDPEAPPQDNVFRVFRMARGSVEEFEDAFLSPRIPTIEDGFLDDDEPEESANDLASSSSVNPQVIRAALLPLIGLPLRRIGRAADLLWMQFGALRELPDRRSGTRIVGEWALHVQCPWRLTRPPAILVARGDCFAAADRDEPYDWTAPGESRFDRCAAALNRTFESSLPRVASVAVDEVGGLALRLTDGYRFEIFPAESTGHGGEHWRLLQPGTQQQHFVFPEEERPASA